PPRTRSTRDAGPTRDPPHPPDRPRPALPRVRAQLREGAAARVRVLLWPARGGLRLRSHRPRARSRGARPPATRHVALPRAPAARRATHGRGARRRHAALARAPARRAPGPARALDQERRGLVSHAVLQRPRGVGGAVEGTRVRHGYGRLRV